MKFERLAAAIVAMVIASVCSFPATALEGQWDRKSAGALIEFAQTISRHGLDPAAYDVTPLAQSLEGEDALAVELSASELFSRLAHDLSAGVTPTDRRRRWRIEGSPLSAAAVSEAMAAALASGDVAAALDDLASRHPQYGSLMKALAKTPESDRQMRLLIARNMERWRWMPRDLGPAHILVNAPSYDAAYYRGGEEIARHRVIIGARKSPTPQFSATVTGVTINPTWYVPQSIVDESVGALLKNKPKEAARLGFYVGEDGGVRQRPGPNNALGEMKLAMANPFSVFIHDTPFRKNFDLEKRALSHGCIRVDDALGLAAEILGDDWDREMIDDLVRTGSTVMVDLPAPIPVYIAYFTAAANEAGDVTAFADIYDLDNTVLSEKRDEREPAADRTELQTCPADLAP